MVENEMVAQKKSSFFAAKVSRRKTVVSCINTAPSKRLTLRQETWRLQFWLSSQDVITARAAECDGRLQVGLK
jgi:hypothetical protein